MVRVITAATVDGWDHTALRWYQLDEDVRAILQDMQDQECPEWEDITDCSPTYKGYWAPWDSLAKTVYWNASGCRPMDGPAQPK
jgi:hypothetical protein